MKCSACGFTQHIEAKYCTNCGAALPQMPNPIGMPGKAKLSLAILVSLIFFCGFGGLLMKLAETPAPKPAEPYPDLATASPSPTAPPLSPEEIRELLRADYELTMQSAHSHLNFIKAKISKTKGGYALMAQHTYFGQHTLKIGGTAGVINNWIDANQSELEKAKVVRVGVKSDDEIGGSSWFNIK